MKKLKKKKQRKSKKKEKTGKNGREPLTLIRSCGGHGKLLTSVASLSLLVLERHSEFVASSLNRTQVLSVTTFRLLSLLLSSFLHRLYFFLQILPLLGVQLRATFWYPVASLPEDFSHISILQVTGIFSVSRLFQSQQMAVFSTQISSCQLLVQ